MLGAVVAGVLALAMSGCSVVSFLWPTSEKEVARVSQAVEALQNGTRLRGMSDAVDGFDRSYTIVIHAEDWVTIDGVLLRETLGAVLPEIRHRGIDRVEISFVHGSRLWVDVKPAMEEFREMVGLPTLWSHIDTVDTMPEVKIAMVLAPEILEAIEDADG